MIFSLPSLILLHQASTSQSYYKPKAQAFLHPIYKDKTTNLYSLPLTIGSNLHSQNFLIDLNGAAPLLLNCTAASTSYHSIRFANPNSSCPKNTTNKPLCRKYVSTSFTDRPVNARLLWHIVGLLYTPNGVYSMDVERSLRWLWCALTMLLPWNLSPRLSVDPLGSLTTTYLFPRSLSPCTSFLQRCLFACLPPKVWSLITMVTFGSAALLFPIYLTLKMRLRSFPRRLKDNFLSFLILLLFESAQYF